MGVGRWWIWLRGTVKAKRGEEEAMEVGEEIDDIRGGYLREWVR